MFNSPILDVTIGLVFIFLLYSLLATSINEAIATLFGLRARMLRNAIVERMLANTPHDNRWMAVYRGFKEFVLEILKIFIGKREKKDEEKKIGDHFFDHPLIKNYGSSRLYPLPSYISAKNFSTVLFEVLKQDFDKRIDEIANYKYNVTSSEESISNIRQNLLYSADISKIKELIDYYGQHYSNSRTPISSPAIDKETWQLLNLHMKASLQNTEKFIERIETWFDDSMNRVSGWYKRQTQIILLFIGIFLSMIFNVDTIEITHKLSVDKDTRDKLVQMAIEASDKYKDDPRVKKIVSNGVVFPDTSNASKQYNDTIFKEYRKQLDSIKQFLEGDLKRANDIVALGWDDYGMRRDSAKILYKYLNDKNCRITLDTSDKKACREFLESVYENHYIKYKLGYVLENSFSGKKFLGFLITAFAIGLGAPFWFDMLNKLVKLRTSGKKEDSAAGNVANTSSAQAPLTIHVNTQPGDEAVG